MQLQKAEEVIANRGSEEDLAEAYEALQNALNNAQLKPATPVTPEIRIPVTARRLHFHWFSHWQLVRYWHCAAVMGKIKQKTKLLFAKAEQARPLRARLFCFYRLKIKFR